MGMTYKDKKKRTDEWRLEPENDNFIDYLYRCTVHFVDAFN